MTREFTYPAELALDEEDGGFVVTFPDLPEAITQGDDLSQALREAEDALEEAIAGRIRRKDSIPRPSHLGEGQHLVPVPALMAAKAALYLAMLRTGIRNSELASRLACDEKEVRRLLDPRHPSKLGRIQAALTALGQQIALRMLDNAA